MFDGLVTIFGVEEKVSKTGKKYYVIGVEKGLDILKLYCPMEKLPCELKRGDKVELTIDINSYDKPIVTKIVK